MSVQRIREHLAAIETLLLELEPANDPAPPSADWTTTDAFEDYGRFYDWLRDDDMLGPRISPPEFEGCDLIVATCAKAGWGVARTAYALATAYHETAHTMQPIKERGGEAYFRRRYDIKGQRPDKARDLGNLTPGDGARFAGRGFVQLTGRTNYTRATAELRQRGIDADLVAAPDRAMEPGIAALVLVAGMAGGWFTSRRIGDDLPPTGPARTEQFERSRDIVNGSDRDEMIAGYAMKFQKALLAGGYREIEA